jgi:ribosome assembly protein 4
VRWGGDGVIYTASSDRTVKLWNSETGKIIRNLSEHAHWVNTLALNTDFVLRTGPFDHTGKLPADDADAQQRARKRYEAFTAAQPELLISGSDDHTLFLWPNVRSEVNPKKPLARLTGHQKQVNHVAFSPDGKWIASCGWDNSVKLWDGRTGRCVPPHRCLHDTTSGRALGLINTSLLRRFIASLRGHVGAVYRVSFSSDSRMLVSASKDSTLKLWNLRTQKLQVDLPGHEDEVFCVDFVADKIASGGRDKVLKM